MKFKKIVEDTQRALREDVREKRLIDISPSTQKPPVKVRSTSSTPGTSRRRSLDFSAGEQTFTLYGQPENDSQVANIRLLSTLIESTIYPEKKSHAL